ncbi:subtilase-type protease inhibitor [Streptomyces sp. NPDC000594]|uniref:subtilase-type protease inhibitor n=1 Tax=Streptomyces sp. NPDC000594 TaxID=3154261 RepID=UPI0033280D87
MRSVRSTIAVSAALVLSGTAAGVAHAAQAPSGSTVTAADSRTAPAAALPLASGSSTGTKAPAHTTGTKRLFAPSALVLTIGLGDGVETAVAVQRAVTLACEPRAIGTHPSPRSACRELRAVDGDFNALSSGLPGINCTRQYEPVTVTADGVWRGQRVDWTVTYTNSCEMAAALGGGKLYSF